MSEHDDKPSPHPALEQGITSHRSGNLDDATKFYRAALKYDPNNADALHLLGVVAQQNGDPAAAIRLIEQAIRIEPLKSMFHFNLGVSLLALNRADEALAAYQTTIRLRPDWPEAHEALAVAYQQFGQHERAVECLLEALRLRPRSTGTLRLLGEMQRKLGRLPESEAAYRGALTLSEKDADAHSGLGITLQRQGRLADAESSFRRATAVRPDNADGHVSLGHILSELDRPAEAAGSYRQALELQPDHRRALTGLGRALHALGRDEESLRILDSIEAGLADDPAVHTGRALALINLGRNEEAAEAYRRALRLRPAVRSVQLKLAELLIRLHRFPEAAAVGRDALSKHPDDPTAWNILGNALLFSGDASQAITSFSRAMHVSPNDNKAISNYLYALNYVSEGSVTDLLAEHRRFTGLFSDTREPTTFAKDRKTGATGRRLRIGYVSADFRAHPVTSFMEPVLRHHDSGRFEIHCYYNHGRVDALTERLMKFVSHWESIHELGDDAAVKLITRDRIDILVDLSGHTSGNRLKVFGRRPSPVQVTWLGSPCFTGLAEIDYWLTDQHVCPNKIGSGAGSERPFHLPDSHVCFLPPSTIPCPAATPASATGQITFGVSCNLAKAGDTSIDLWARTLSRLPDSRLIMIASGLGACQDVLAARFLAHGIAPERIDFRDRMPLLAYLELHGAIDILLDSYPYAGGSTNFNALWMGVPVISLAGALPASRCGSIAQSVLGLEDLIASTPHEYVERAVRLAGNLNRLNELRTTLREKMSRSVLVDGEAFTRNLEAAYMEMWHAWCDPRQI